ncbi:MAG: aminotransferase class IV [Chloroflexota bacterium]
MPRHIWLDGRLLPAHGPHLHVTDRGFQLGDGVFETLRVRRGVPIEWDRHLARLQRSATALAIRLPVGEDLLRSGMAELLAAEALDAPGDDERAPGDAAVRITISRGPLEQRGTLPPGWEAATATVAIQAWAYTPPPAGLLARGVRAITSSIRRDPSNPLAGIKTTARAELVYAKLEAERAGADDALFLTHDGRVSEATSANVFAMTGDELVTPPGDAAILAGATRAWLLTEPAVRALNLTPVEGNLRPVDLLAADEVFLTASVAGIVPLTAFDGRPIGTGRPGARTLRLREIRERWIDAQSLAANRGRGELPSRMTGEVQR